MYIERLSLTQFRNYSSVTVPLTRGINTIIGPNGHGKTNLLEALYTVTQGHSFRTSKILECIGWNEPHCVVRAEGFVGNRPLAQSYKLTTKNKKQVKVNNQESAQLSQLIGSFCVVPIVSNDIEMVQGAPANRRKFMDSVIAQHSLSFLQTLKDYNRTLKQRNALLKAERERTPLWETLTEQLVRLGSDVILTRKRFIDTLSPTCSRFYETVSGAAEELTLGYHTSITQEIDEGSLKHLFLNKLIAKSRVEFELGSTLYGPHKDDVTLQLNGHDARTFGSQGQCRSIALTLRFAAAHMLEDRVGEAPILLLDDIFAELDNNRRLAVGNLISHHAQVLVATPHREDLPFATDSVIEIVKGDLA
ncbi:MAG: DNA replication/repair protein RecF [Fibrobacterales bacterium]